MKQNTGRYKQKLHSNYLPHGLLCLFFFLQTSRCCARNKTKQVLDNILEHSKNHLVSNGDEEGNHHSSIYTTSLTLLVPGGLPSVDQEEVTWMFTIF